MPTILEQSAKHITMQNDPQMIPTARKGPDLVSVHCLMKTAVALGSKP